MFGRPVRLTYKGKDIFKTVCGATATIILIIFCLLYIIINVRKVIVRDDYNVTYRELQSTSEISQVVNVADEGFDFAFKLTGTNVDLFDKTYINF